MKSFTDNSFLRLFDEVVRRDRGKSDCDAWSGAGVQWRRSRHSFETQTHGFTIELFEGTKSGRAGWTLLVVREHWWAGRHGDVVRTTHWGKPLAGKRADIALWFDARKKEFGL